MARWFIIRVRTTSTGLEAMAPASPHVKLELHPPNQGRDSSGHSHSRSDRHKIPPTGLYQRHLAMNMSCTTCSYLEKGQWQDLGHHRTLQSSGEGNAQLS